MKEPLLAAAADFHFSPAVIAAAQEAVDECMPAWRLRDDQALTVTAKVVGSFERAGINESHLVGTTGYGYYDHGREKYEALLAALMGASRALARIQLVSGTQAIVMTLAALLRDGGTLCALTGRPYDTLRLAIADHHNSIAKLGVRYFETPWRDGESLADADVLVSLEQKPDVVFIQRSRGYARRPSLPIARIESLIAAVRAHTPDTFVVVDNCYGEFVEPDEPGDVGADATVGSLIKNPGGGLATSGAYIAGTNDVVDRVAERLFAPGLQTDIGPSFGALRWLFAGLHRAPKAVAESLKIMDFAASLFVRLGYRVDPQAGAHRTDTIQAIELGGREKIIPFVAGLQRLLPVNSRAKPEPGRVPGYAEDVIMASGAFVSGSTIELSCDAPLRPPYEVYVQGGMDLAHGVLALMSAASAIHP